jgi:hypothetical protein
LRDCAILLHRAIAEHVMGEPGGVLKSTPYNKAQEPENGR